MSIFSYHGTPEQQDIARRGMARFHHPNWERLLPKLRLKGRTAVPIEWDDLTTYKAQIDEQKASGGHGHVHVDGDTADPVEFRDRVLGLAWYSGKITLEQSLVNEPELAVEVLAAEMAHIIDFFDPLMDGGGRERINVAYHGGQLHDHGHDQWFDEGGYFDWPGESFMEGCTRAFSDIPITMTGFTHKTTPEVVAVIRDVLDPTPPYGGVTGSKVFHRSTCFMLRLAGGADVTWPSFSPAVLAGRRPCKLCRP